jgi:hypothetical protein
MIGEVNFHSRPQRHIWAEYGVLAASLIVAFAVVAGV